MQSLRTSKKTSFDMYPITHAIIFQCTSKQSIYITLIKYYSLECRSIKYRIQLKCSCISKETPTFFVVKTSLVCFYSYYISKMQIVIFLRELCICQTNTHVEIKFSRWQKVLTLYVGKT